MAGAQSSDFDAREMAHCHPQLLPVSDCLVCGVRFCSKCAYEILKNPKTQNCYCVHWLHYILIIVRDCGIELGSFVILKHKVGQSYV